MSQAKITNFFGKPKNGSSKEVDSKEVSKRPKKANAETKAEAQTTITKKRKMHNFFSQPSNFKRKLTDDENRELSTSPHSSSSQLDLWTSTYRPRSADQLVGNGRTRAHFADWLSSWSANFVEDGASGEILAGKCAFLSGPSGSGKTSTVYATAADAGHSVLEFSCASTRISPTFLAKEVAESLQSHCINLTKKSSKAFGKSLILLDDFDALLYEQSPPVSLTEVWRQLRGLITSSQKPIVITAAYEPGFFCTDGDQLTLFRHFKLAAIHQSVLRRHLKETISFKEEEEEEFCMPSSSNSGALGHCQDARRLINECQFWCSASKLTPKREAEDPLPSGKRRQLTIQAGMDLLSLEDVYQTTLNRLAYRSTQLGDYYNSHLFDRRDSLLTAMPGLQLQLQSFTGKENDEDSSLDSSDQLVESIRRMIGDHYLPLMPRNPDYFALLFDLISLRPGLLAELDKLFSSRQMRRSGRLQRHQKLSFRYL